MRAPGKSNKASSEPCPNDGDRPLFTRREWLRTGSALGLAGVAGAAGVASLAASPSGTGHEMSESEKQLPGHHHATSDDSPHQGPPSGNMHTVGTVDHLRNGFDPMAMLYDFDYGKVSHLPSGQRLREYEFVAEDREIEIAPGVFFPAWTYNGRVPGPTIRCVEGDRVRVRFTNAGSHPHTIHFHGIHQAAMDGVPGIGAGLIEIGGSTVYEFDAAPFGCHLYHCHTLPLKRHMHKGMYGAFIIDPDPERYTGAEREAAKRRNHEYAECQAVNEMVMVMNGFDTNFDGDNEVYAVNTVAFAYSSPGIPINSSVRQRLYLINATEFDPINSFHLHGNFYDYYDHGTSFEPTSKRVDTIMQCQGQRGIIEFSYKGFKPGSFMFHAHQSEFAELGWMGFFDVDGGSRKLA